jgi:uncharacterized RDD family membrane protein YckC
LSWAEKQQRKLDAIFLMIFFLMLPILFLMFILVPVNFPAPLPEIIHNPPMAAWLSTIVSFAYALLNRERDRKKMEAKL